MPLDTDRTIRERLGQLIRETQSLREGNRGNSSNFVDEMLVEFTKIKTHTVTLVHSLIADATLKDKFVTDIDNLAENIEGITKLEGKLKALQHDYKTKLLGLKAQIETDTALNFMSMANELLGEGVSGQYDYVPAAVLAGAILEDALRRLCGRQNISTIHPNGKHKMLKNLIDDLKKSKIFNEPEAKQLEGWATTRNFAAHGEFSKFNRSNVEHMITGIEKFLTDYP